MQLQVPVVFALCAKCGADTCGVYRDAMLLALMMDRTRENAQKGGGEVWVRRDVAALRRKRKLGGCLSIQWIMARREAISWLLRNRRKC